MSHQVNSHDFPQVYSQLGIDVSELGCVMLDVAPIPVTSFIPETEGKIERELYVSGNPKFWWIDGAVAEKKSHITLLYGLLQKDWQEHIRAVLADWQIPTMIEVEGLEVFDSPVRDEHYACIVARIKLTPDLIEGHSRLELLPHVNTFLEWRAHVTLAYVRSEYRDKWVRALEQNLPQFLPVVGIDIGEITP